MKFIPFCTFYAEHCKYLNTPIFAFSLSFDRSTPIIGRNVKVIQRNQNTPEPNARVAVEG